VTIESKYTEERINKKQQKKKLHIHKKVTKNFEEIYVVFSM
jgi:hypothetical protein